MAVRKKTGDLHRYECMDIVASIRSIMYPTQNHEWSPDTLDAIARVLDKHGIATPEPRPPKVKKTA